MKRDYRLFLKDIIDACGHIRAFVQGMDEDAFVLDEKTCSAVIQKFEVIGEAVKNIAAVQGGTIVFKKMWACFIFDHWIC